MSEIKRFKIENGALVEVPIYETHRRGKNWLAKIQKDPKSPGGLKREFMENAKGSYYYLINGLSVGDVVEFGADYYTVSGKKGANRVYGIIRLLTDNELELEQFNTPNEAFTNAIKLEIQPENPLAKFTNDELIAELKRRGAL